MMMKLFFFLFVWSISLQQFVRGCGSFALEMGNAILNSLTSGRHAKLQENTLKQKEETEKVASKSPTEVSIVTLLVVILLEREGEGGRRRRRKHGVCSDTTSNILVTCIVIS